METARKDRPDFVMVRLSAVGIDHAKGAPDSDGKRPYDVATLRIANAHSDYRFTDDQPVEVLRTEWTNLFSQERIGQDAAFEIVPAQTAQPTPTQPAVVPAEGEEHEA